MALKTWFAASLVCAIAAALPAHAQDHPCAGDATARAKKLLRFHFEDKTPLPTVDDGTTARVLPPISALKGNGKFDVLEVTSHIYKGTYRMRFIYARIQGSCALMGQEILEASNPY